MVSWYTATAEQTRPLLLECESCGCRAQAVVTARARGPAIITALGTAGAHRAAGERAAEAARGVAEGIVRVVTCPRCRARRTRAAIAMAVVPALHLLWLAPVLGGLALFVAVMMGNAGSYLPAIFALGALSAFAPVALLLRRKLRLADDAVRFVDVRGSR